jgi:hypothetical protein
MKASLFITLAVITVHCRQTFLDDRSGFLDETESAAENDETTNSFLRIPRPERAIFGCDYDSNIGAGSTENLRRDKSQTLIPLFKHSMQSLGCDMQVQAWPMSLLRLHPDETYLEIELRFEEDPGGLDEAVIKRCCGGYARGYISQGGDAYRSAVDIGGEHADIDSLDALDAALLNRSACCHRRSLWLPRPGPYRIDWHYLYVGFQGMFDHHDRVVQTMFDHFHFHV